MSQARSTRQIGFAFDGINAAIAWRDANVRQPHTHTRTVPCDGTPHSVSEAIRVLSDGPQRVGDVTVTLDRPLAHVRTLRMPAMARTTLEAILARDWSRYVIAHRVTPHTARAQSIEAGAWLAAFAPADILDEIADALALEGLHRSDTRATDDAIAGAIRELAPDDVREGDCVAILCDGTRPTHATQIRKGRPLLGRRFLADATYADADAFIQGSREKDNAPSVLLIGHASRTASLARDLGMQGVRTRTLDLGATANATALELIALAGRIGRSVLPLEASRTRERRRQSADHLARWLLAGAAAALVVGFGFANWQTGRALSDVQRARADISGAVRNAMAGRTALEESTSLTAALAERESNASRASTIMAAIAVALPSNTTLSALAVSGDSVTIEGESNRSAAVYEALRAVRELEQVKLASPLRQERQAGDVAVEHFAFNARIRGTR